MHPALPDKVALAMRTLLLTSLILLPPRLSAQVYLTRDEALKLYFENATVEKKSEFLTDEQVARIQEVARSKVESKIVTYYIATRNDNIVGYAFVETHVVRTMPETFMAVVAPDGSLSGVEILAFYEPEDYLPPQRWLTLLRGKTLDDDLWLKRGIQNIVGATLSANAITGNVRRVLATYSIAIRKER